MKVARRSFLKQGAGVAVAGGVLASVGQPAFGKLTPPRPLDGYPTLTEFADALYSWFMVESAGGPPSDWIRLVKVTDLRSEAVKGNPAYDGKECFALIFSGASGRGSVGRSAAWVPEGIHRLRHDRLGDLTLLVSPAGRDAGGPLYAAVINQLMP